MEAKKKWCWGLAGVALLLVGAGVANAADQGLPAGTVFVGLDGSGWKLYFVPESGAAPNAVPTETEPRTPSYDPQSGRIAYIAADGSLLVSKPDGSEKTRLLPASDAHTFTQPAYAPASGALYVVALSDGNSADTALWCVDPDGDVERPALEQRFAQFEPHVAADGYVYYGNAHCAGGCGRVIQEIWRFDPVSGQARQLTLRNAYSREPATSPSGKLLFYASNVAGSFDIWRQALDGGEPTRLTHSDANDLSVSIDAEGGVYFVRRAPDAVRVMRIREGGRPEQVPLPAPIRDVRSLRVGRR